MYEYKTNKDIVLFDLETKKAPNTEGISWTDFDKMGIAVGCAYHFKQEVEASYFDDNLQGLVDSINNADLVVGFNHSSFDLPLLRATAQVLGLERPLKPNDQLPIFDILVESRLGAGADRFAKGFKLADHLAATLGPWAVKAGSGAFAPVLWQQGKIGELLHYCLQDVRLTRRLFLHLSEFGCLAVPGREPYRVMEPFSVITEWQAAHQALAPTH